MSQPQPANFSHSADFPRVLADLPALLAERCPAHRYAVIAENELNEGARAAILAALQDGQRLTQASLPGLEAAQIRALWVTLNPAQVETIIGFLQEDSPLFQNLRSLGDDVAALVADILRTGVILGRNPRVIARMITQATGQGLTWSLNMARTAQLYAYREASRATFLANSHVVKGWQWFAEIGDPHEGMDGAVGSGPGDFSNDGDYNDYVYLFEGLVCVGGGEACDTGMPGICATGVTECSAGSIVCRPTVAGRTETCNGLDDDCNAATDDGDDDVHSPFERRRDRAHDDAAEVHVERARPARAKLRLHRRCRGGELTVRRRRRHDDKVDVSGRDACLLERHLRCVHRERAADLVRRGDVPFDDARAIPDPLVGRLDHLLQIGVREDALRQVMPESGDAGVDHVRSVNVRASVRVYSNGHLQIRPRGPGGAPNRS